MNTTEQHAFTFTVPLTTEAHRVAQTFYHHHAQSEKAKQVYLNTLSVLAVQFYLTCLGIETDTQQSQSWNPTLQVLSDAADLWVKGRGRLECRPVLPGMQDCVVPAEVWTNDTLDADSTRIGYVFVQLNAELTEATLLGFLPTVTSETVALSDLQSLDRFPEFLAQVKPQSQRQPESIPSAPTRLSHWLQQMVGSGWEALETLWQQPDAAPQLAYQFRQLAPQTAEAAASSVKRGKRLSLGQSPEGQLVLLVGIAPVAQSAEFQITVELYPMAGQRYLPRSLQVMIIDAAGQGVLQADGTHSEGLEFQFSGEAGEPFTVQIRWNTVCIEEVFEI